MRRILISTIVRNDAHVLARYHAQLETMVQSSPHEFHLSIFENDSTDETKDMLKSLDWGFVSNEITRVNLGWPFYESTPLYDRVEKLAHCRNKTIECDFLSAADDVLVVDADVIIPLNTALAVIERDGAADADIYSPMCVWDHEGDGVAIQIDDRAHYLYDTWATRRLQGETRGDFYPDHVENPIRPFWSTMNGICLYRAQPFKDGVRYTAFNRHTQKSDCEPAILCEDFRSHGYGNVMVNQGLFTFHET